MIIQAFLTGEAVPVDAVYLSSGKEIVTAPKKVKMGQGKAYREKIQNVDTNTTVHYFLVPKKTKDAKKVVKS